ncbi:bifunctional allantoicase/(S)-ureidoglycine aminohydrolase [uncultured Tateyamaria sp.]|uniref:bifunctional allantoicase/(S)-ureidoglycine aminohydrolase n=1 Tax=uncultured Tateyamaria sp. TaxID=455651 RepID=UPI0026204DC5|nr:bifunctional allantoicase/(S)-ureidoglycine aminohydrolase [uncultured Tateyamaria sp.]
MTYAFPPGGLPDQTVSPEGKAVFTTAYAVIPAVTQRDIVTSFLPGWDGMRMWVLARPLSGFAETFSQYAVELTADGGSETPEVDEAAQSVLFFARGTATLTIGGDVHSVEAGSYAFIPAGTDWAVRAGGDGCQFHWVRKRYVAATEVAAPTPFVTHDRDVPPTVMPNTDKWATTRFVDPADLRHDFHVNIVTFQPGGRIPFAETHVMEHGLYVLEGTAEYLLNTEWVSVGPGDFMWLRAFCPQACIATGDGPFRYLLYKDVNRHVPL